MKKPVPHCAGVGCSTEKELKLLYAHVVSTQETERRRMSRELHDGVGQILSGIKFRLEALPAKVLEFPEQADAEIAKLGGFLDRAIFETRRVSQNLMPSELHDLGLLPALRTLCREFKDRLKIPVTITCARMPNKLHPDISLALFRITQEALNNVGKHARAKNIEVILSRKSDGLQWTLSDDGKGSTAVQRMARGRLGGVGLANMRERAESVGGTMDMRSQIGKGTTLSVWVPL